MSIEVIGAWYCTGDPAAGRKVMITALVSAHGKVCARGEVVAVQVPEHMLPDSALKNPIGAEERER